MASKSDLAPLKGLTEDTFRSTTFSYSNNNLLAPPSLDAVWNTVAEVQRRTNSNPSASAHKPSAYYSPSLSLIYECDGDDDGDPGSPSTVSRGPPGPNALATSMGDFLVELVRAANETANSNACSSVLAGQSSESDEFGDVGILINSNLIDASHDLRKKAKNVLLCMGLDTPVSSGRAKVSPLSLSEKTSLPNSIVYTLGDATVQRLSALVSKPDSPFAFTLDPSDDDGGVVFHFLLGKSRTLGGSVWAGLLAVGIWT